MASPHSGHTATLLSNGRVLVVGGFGTSSQATAELYDPGSNSWSSAGSVADGRVQHTATVLPNGRVLVAGGENSTAGGTYLATTELYDPGPNNWTKAASMANAHVGHSATLLSNGQLLIVGGKDAKGFVNAAERYDPAANSWSPAGALSTSRWLHSAALLPNGQVLVLGGRGDAEALASAERYDP